MAGEEQGLPALKKGGAWLPFGNDGIWHKRLYMYICTSVYADAETLVVYSNNNLSGSEGRMWFSNNTKISPISIQKWKAQNSGLAWIGEKGALLRHHNQIVNGCYRGHFPFNSRNSTGSHVQVFWIVDLITCFWIFQLAFAHTFQRRVCVKDQP